MSETKCTCQKCFEEKILEKDFYTSKGKFRSDCKKCTVKRNVEYQRSLKTWMHRFVDEDQKRLYMHEYYANNKEKFAEYRRKFREKYPSYHKDYCRKRRQEMKK